MYYFQLNEKGVETRFIRNIKTGRFINQYYLSVTTNTLKDELEQLEIKDYKFFRFHHNITFDSLLLSNLEEISVFEEFPEFKDNFLNYDYTDGVYYTDVTAKDIILIGLYTKIDASKFSLSGCCTIYDMNMENNINFPSVVLQHHRKFLITYGTEIPILYDITFNESLPEYFEKISLYGRKNNFLIKKIVYHLDEDYIFSINVPIKKHAALLKLFLL